MISARLLTLPLLVAATAAFGADKVTYVDHVLPIFRNSCLNCHNPDKKKAGLDLTTYQGTLAGSENGKVILPGNADGSLLYKCVSPGGDPKMPPKGDRLTDAELAVVKNWIVGFALENATGKPAAVAQNAVALAVVSLTKPDGPPPMPGDLPLEPFLRTRAPNALTALAASPWAPLVALGGQKQIVLYNTETLQALGVLAFPEGFPTIIRFSRNGQLLLTGGGYGGKSGKVVLWNVLTGERSGTVGDEVDQVLAADVSPDHAHVALGGPTKILKIYSTKDGKLEQSIKKHTDWVTAVAFSPEGKYLASADRNGGIAVWEGASGKEFNVLPGHKAMVTALAFMPGVLASGGEDGKITLWDVKEGKEIRTWDGHPGGVESVDFTPDGRLVSCGRDRVAKVWTQDAKVTTTSAPLADVALRAVLSNERVIAGDWSGKVSVFGLDGKPIGELNANPPPIADQLAAAQKAFTDAQAACGPLQQAVAAAEAKLKAEKEAAEAKRVADLAAAQQRAKDAQAAMAAAQAAVPALEKQLADATAQITAARQVRDAAKAANDAGTDAAKVAALDEAQKKVDALKPTIEQLTNQVAAAKNEQPAKMAAADKALKEAQAQIAALQAPAAAAPAATPAPAPAAAPDAAKVAELKKQLDALTAEIAKRRADRATKKEGTPEYQQADAQVQAIKPDLAKAEAAFAAASGTPAPAAAPAPTAPKLSPTEEEVAKAKAGLEAANGQVAAAKGNVERWTRAQSFMVVHRAQASFLEKKARHEDLVATAGSALQPIEQTQAQIAGLEKATTEAPAKIQQAEAALVQATQARDAANKAMADAQAAVAEKEKSMGDPKKVEAEVAELTKKLEGQNAEIAKRRADRATKTQGTPEYAAADALVQGIKPEIAQTEAAIAAAKAKVDPAAADRIKAELLAAKVTVQNAEAAAKLATGKVPVADQAVAKAKAESAQGASQLAELKKKIPEITKAAKAAKAKAEQEAAALVKEIEKAKVEAERARADYNAKWPPAQKSATASATPAKSS